MFIETVVNGCEDEDEDGVEVVSEDGEDAVDGTEVDGSDVEGKVCGVDNDGVSDEGVVIVGEAPCAVGCSSDRMRTVGVLGLRSVASNVVVSVARGLSR